VTRFTAKIPRNYRGVTEAELAPPESLGDRAEAAPVGGGQEV